MRRHVPFESSRLKDRKITEMRLEALREERMQAALSELTKLKNLLDKCHRSIIVDEFYPVNPAELCAMVQLVQKVTNHAQ